ncbi:MAG: hypothetical protein AAGG48_14690 [Planctomycetota bacterium]
MSVDFANTCAWLDLLFSKASHDDGSVIAVSSTRRKVIGAYGTDGDSLVACAKRMNEQPGCYLKVNLMDAAAMKRRGPHVVGNREEVKSIVSIHCDVDAGKSSKYPARSTALWAINQMPLPPTLIINSNGEEGGFHVYWCLKRPHRIKGDREDIQRLSTAWQGELRKRLGGMLDNTSNIDRVLRCVGVPRQDGGKVSCHTYNVDALYTLRDLSKAVTDGKAKNNETGRAHIHNQRCETALSEHSSSMAAV